MVIAWFSNRLPRARQTAYIHDASSRQQRLDVARAAFSTGCRRFTRTLFTYPVPITLPKDAAESAIASLRGHLDLEFAVSQRTGRLRRPRANAHFNPKR